MLLGPNAITIVAKHENHLFGLTDESLWDFRGDFFKFDRAYTDRRMAFGRLRAAIYRSNVSNLFRRRRK